MLKRILVPVDFTSTSMTALHRAAELATELDAEMVILHADELPLSASGDLPSLPQYVVDQQAEDVKRKMADVLNLSRVEGWNARGMIVRGPAASVISSTAESEAVDLIVMGTHGRRGFRRFMLGSVAEQVILTSKVPVMTVAVPASATASEVVWGPTRTVTGGEPV